MPFGNMELGVTPMLPAVPGTPGFGVQLCVASPSYPVPVGTGRGAGLVGVRVGLYGL